MHFIFSATDIMPNTTWVNQLDPQNTSRSNQPTTNHTQSYDDSNPSSDTPESNILPDHTSRISSVYPVLTCTASIAGRRPKSHRLKTYLDRESTRLEVRRLD